MTTLSQNLFNMNNNMTVGTLVSGGNVITAEFYSATGTDTLVPGEMVKMVGATRGTNPRCSVGSAATDAYFGVVTRNPLSESSAVGAKVEVALDTCIVMMTASAAITGGAKLQYDYSTKKVATQTSTNTVIGIALASATADGQLIPVYVSPNWLTAGEANTVSNAGTGSDGVAIVLAKVGADIPVKRIKAGTGITITEQTNGITIALS